MRASRKLRSDVGKLHLRLVKDAGGGIWTETDNPAWSPVLRKPNRYQTIVKFIEGWITSKLVHGNTYVLKARDARGVVNALYVLDPTRVRPLVAPDGGVYYELGRRDAGRPERSPAWTPRSPDRPGLRDHPRPDDRALSPAGRGVARSIACGVSALQGQTIQNNSSRFFAQG